MLVGSAVDIAVGIIVAVGELLADDVVQRSGEPVEF